MTKVHALLAFSDCWLKERSLREAMHQVEQPFETITKSARRGVEVRAFCCSRHCRGESLPPGQEFRGVNEKWKLESMLEPHPWALLQLHADNLRDHLGNCPWLQLSCHPNPGRVRACCI